MSEAQGSGARNHGARGFPAFAARRGGRARGQSYWAAQWTEAVEDVWPEEGPLRKGRSFARTGRIGPITVSPGRVAAEVYGGEETYRTRLTLTVLDDDEWDLLWEKTADRPAETEALLAGDLPEDLLEAVEDARVRMLPGYGDLDADCDCDALDHPCPHATALAYQLSWLLDTDPWLLLLIRGRTAEEAVEELKSALLLRALTGPDEPGEPVETEPEEAAPPPDTYAAQRAAYARPATPLPALPPLPDPPTAPEEPLTGIEADPLDRLAADAALRARELLVYAHGFGAAPPEPLDTWEDTVRLAATHPDPRAVQRLREGCGRPAEDLDRAAAAWRTGGRAALDVLEHSWAPPEQQTAQARTALATAWEAEELPPITVDGNHWTLTDRGLQLRLAHDGRWYPYRHRDTGWWPAGPPSTDPAETLADLTGLAADDDESSTDGQL
ncbi:SWIM zinc finger family protein [Streptomyces sp. GESEQ-13]|uniref:SWIM zinc finger family protein n=1 Tax=Streptomyces sp. GESEQ-13 TaxID=2812654 RepID=UPI001B331CA1